MEKIPKGNTKKLKPLNINKKMNHESNGSRMKTKNLSNNAITKSFGRDITNISKNKENIKIPKKSSSYNDKVSNIKNIYVYLEK